MDMYLLGAGFSKAIYSGMPLMDDLGRELVGALNLDRDTLVPFGGNLETWLSYLAEDQPWLSDKENLKNTALFMGASEAIAEFIELSDPSQSNDSTTGACFDLDMLFRLVHKWCTERNAIMSFNYDLLVEASLEKYVQHVDKRHLYGLPIISRRDTTGRFATRSDDNRPTLYKLHGSINWLYGGIKYPNSSIVLREDDDFGNSYDDLEPVIIPPTSSKSSFYSNEALRAQWRNAGRDLQNADRLIVIGYSMPESDLQVKAMLTTSLKANAEIVVVDPDTDQKVVPRIRSYFPGHQVTHLPCLESYIEQHCDLSFFWFPTDSLRVEHFGKDKHYRSRRTTTPPIAIPPADSYVHTTKAKDNFGKIWPGITAGPSYDNESLTRLFVPNTEYEKQPDPWASCSHVEVLDLPALYPEVYRDLSDYETRRMTRVFGGAWANGWSPNLSDVKALADYLLDKCSRESIVEKFGPQRVSLTQTSQTRQDLDDDTSMAKYLIEDTPTSS